MSNHSFALKYRILKCNYFLNVTSYSHVRVSDHICTEEKLQKLGFA